MKRSITAQLSKIALEVRLPYYWKLQAAADNPDLPLQTRMTCRLAARAILSSLDSKDYDIMYRLQVLEGVANPASAAQGGKWWREGRRGLIAAKRAFAEMDINPLWFSSENTGLVRVVVALIRRGYQKWSNSYRLTMTWEDMVQRSIMGLSQNNEPLSGGPHAMSIGAKNPQVRKAILNGSEEPAQVGGLIAKFSIQKIGDELKLLYRQTGGNTDERGSILDRAEQGLEHRNRSFFEILVDALYDPQVGARIQQLLKDEFEKYIGTGKMADVALDVFLTQLSGEQIKNKDLAARHGIEPGTLSKVIRTRMVPAFERLQKDTAFKDRILELTSVHLRRRSTRQQSARG